MENEDEAGNRQCKKASFHCTIGRSDKEARPNVQEMAHKSPRKVQVYVILPPMRIVR